MLTDVQNTGGNGAIDITNSCNIVKPTKPLSANIETLVWQFSHIVRPSERERERLQCFSQPASLITYRRRQRSNVENIKTVQNELENLHMILLCKKGSHGVCVRGKQRSIPLPMPGELDTQKSCAIHLQQPNYHNVCRLYWLWQHADPQQNARERLAVDESPA